MNSPLTNLGIQLPTEAIERLRNIAAVFFDIAGKVASQVDWQEFKSALDELIQKMEYYRDELPKDVQIVNDELIERGWFVWLQEGYLEEFYERVIDLRDMTPDEADAYLEDYITSLFPHIQQAITDANPEKTPQLQAAFEAHDAGIYFASIPTFLAIAEGIARKVVQASPYEGIKKKDTPKISAIFNEPAEFDIVDEAILKPLKVKSVINKSIFKPNEHEHTLLNRHLIMHGKSDNYGSRMNSLKAISWLYFIHEAIYYVNESQADYADKESQHGGT